MSRVNLCLKAESAGRVEATGRGVQFGLREMFRNPDDVKDAGLSGTLEGKKIVIQGLGNVGYHAAKFLSEEDGAKIVAVVERDGAVYSDVGIDIEELTQFKKETGGVKGFSGAKFEPNGPVLMESECDILIPAALESQITAENAGKIQAKIIAEAANGPVTFEARRNPTKEKQIRDSRFLFECWRCCRLLFRVD